ncbi:MAG: hypothetical protein KY468_01420 [Armatimonadetes bacterium]|nr:hypothetical protein [Armatimonadota bacterium]
MRADKRLGTGVLRVTTHEVFTEYLAAMARFAHLRTLAVEVVRAMRRDPSVYVISPSLEMFDRGLGRYENRPDKNYSLVDCISMVVMEEEGIHEILTNDHHFEQEGFTILIRK